MKRIIKLTPWLVIPLLLSCVVVYVLVAQGQGPQVRVERRVVIPEGLVTAQSSGPQIHLERSIQQDASGPQAGTIVVKVPEIYYRQPPDKKWRCPLGHVSSGTFDLIDVYGLGTSKHCFVCFSLIIRALVPGVVEVKEKETR